MLKKIQEAYNEYFLTKMASAFSPHFCRPLGMEGKLTIPDDDRKCSSYSLEILQEYGGLSLKFLSEEDGLSWDQICNHMVQSANAMSLLHSSKIAHLDLKPHNIVYSKSHDLLKIIDFGISTPVENTSALIKPALPGKVKGFTQSFSPPEILEGNPSPILGSIDIYCWGMTFYALLNQKTSACLKDEAAKKSQGFREYDAWMTIALKELETN